MSSPSAVKGLYSLKGVKVQQLVELLSFVLNDDSVKKLRIAIAKKAFRNKKISLRKGQAVKVISENENTVKVEVNGLQEVLPNDISTILQSPRDWPTSAVIEYIIKPHNTAAKQKFYVDTLAPNPEVVDKYGLVYIVHSHQSRFYDLVHSLVSYFKGKNLSQQIVWLDALCVNQHVFSATSRREFVRDEAGNFQTQPLLDVFLVQELHQIIAECQSCLIFLDKWDDSTTLTRTWCLWEMFGAIRQLKCINFCLTSKETARLEKELAADFKLATKKLQECRIQGAGVTIEDDKFTLDNHIRTCQQYSEDTIDFSIAKLLRGWLGDLGIHVVHQLKKGKGSAIQVAHLANQVGLQIWGELSHDRVLYETMKQRVADAEQLFRTSLAGYKRAVGPQHEFVAVANCNLASVLAHKGDRDPAVRCLKGAISIRQALAQSDDNKAQLAKCLNLLAELVRDQGDFERAETVYNKAIGIWKELHGSEHIMIATAYNNLGELLRIEKRQDEAEKMFKDALSMLRKEGKAQNFLLMVTIYNNLGLVYEDRGDDENAEKAYQLSLRIIRKIAGDSNPEVADALTNLASYLFTKGKYAASEPYLRDSVKVQTRINGRSHQMVGQALENLAIILGAEGKTDEARKTMTQAVAVFEKSLGEEHPRTQKCRSLIPK